MNQEEESRMSDTQNDNSDIPLLFQTFNKNAKRKEKVKWWNNLYHLVSTRERHASTNIPGDDNATLTGIIYAFQQLSRVTKTHSDTNTNRAIILFQCLLRIDITKQCAKANGITSFMDAVKAASYKFRNNEKCMELLISWIRDRLQVNHTEQEQDDAHEDNILVSYLASMGHLLIGTALNADFLFVLRRESINVCEMLLNSMSLNDLKSCLDGDRIKHIGFTIQICGDWSLQNILLRWMSAYYMNCKLCLSQRSSQNNILNRIESKFYTGLFHEIKSVQKSDNLVGIKRQIEDKVNAALFYLTEDEYNATFKMKKKAASDILLHYNSVIYPNNSVWSVNITEAAIYSRTKEDEHYCGSLKLHIGPKLFHIEYDEYKKNCTVLWDGVTKFESDENALLCEMHFTDFTKEETVLYRGHCEDIEYIKFKFENMDSLQTLTQDISNILPEKTHKISIHKQKNKSKIKTKSKTIRKKQKKTKRTYDKKRNRNSVKQTGSKVTNNTYSKRKRRSHIDANKNEANDDDAHAEESEEKEDDLEVMYHIVSSTDYQNGANMNIKAKNNTQKSCDIDLTDIDPECGDFIRFKTIQTASDESQTCDYGQVTMKSGDILDVKLLNGDKRFIDIQQVECDILTEEEKEAIWRETENEEQKKQPQIITETEPTKMAVKEASLTTTNMKKTQANDSQEQNENEDESEMKVDEVQDIKQNNETVENKDEEEMQKEEREKEENMDEIKSLSNEMQCAIDEDENNKTLVVNAAQDECNAEIRAIDQVLENEIDTMDVEENKKKEGKVIILIADSSQSQPPQSDHDIFASRPLLHKTTPKLPEKHALPITRSTKRNKHSTSTSKKSTIPKWRKRAPLALKNSARNKNIKEIEKEQLPLFDGVTDEDIDDISSPQTSKGVQSMNIDEREQQQEVLRFHHSRKRKHGAFDEDANIAPPKKKRKTVIMMEEKQTQTEGGMCVNIEEIEAQITSRFKILFENLFRDKMEELKHDNDEFRQFLREKVSKTNDIQNDYNSKMKQVQSEIFNKIRSGVLKKWKDDVMDVMDVLDEHAANIQSQNDTEIQNRNNNLLLQLGISQRSNSADDIVHQIKSLLTNYNQN